MEVWKDIPGYEGQYQVKLQKDIAAEFNVCLSTISAIKRGEHFGWLK